MFIIEDTIIALPIGLILLSIMLASIYSNQSYMSLYARSEYSEIRYISISQQMIALASNSTGNYTETQDSLYGLARYYNVSVNFTIPADYGQCTGRFCRIIEIDGMTRLAVIR